MDGTSLHTILEDALTKDQHMTWSCPKEMDIAPVVTTPPVEPGVADSAIRHPR